MSFYNLIVSNISGQWDRNPTSFPSERVFEYTKDYVREKFLNADESLNDEICKLPTIFVNEFHHDEPARVGFVRSVIEENGESIIEFEYSPLIPPIPVSTLKDLSFELDIARLEGGRTHWAVKHIDLLGTLERHGLIPEIELKINENNQKIDVYAATQGYSLENQADGPKRPIFVSYSHVDKAFLERLKVHLKPLERWFELELWHDQLITPGDDWKEEIEAAINECSAAILIVSADFIASDFISSNEIPPLLKAAQDRGVRIIPIIAKPCLFTSHPELSRFQSINSPENSLIGMGEAERESTYLTAALTLQGLL